MKNILLENTTAIALYSIFGRIENNEFCAEIRPAQRFILIYSVDKNAALPNMGTEQRIFYVAKRLKLVHRLLFWLGLWSVVEIQTCFGVTTLKKITGVNPRKVYSASYNHLSENELKLVTPLLPNT